MNRNVFTKKLYWWIKEHLYFYKQILSSSQELKIELPLEYGDWLVHPCIRYIPEGINGYKWWLAVSPYPNFDNKKENILLYKGSDSADNEPPTEWIFVKEVCGSHEKGYNSDPNLIYYNKELWIIWRERYTENVIPKEAISCIMLSKTNDGINFSSPELLIVNTYKNYGNIKGDSTMCPCAIYFQNQLKLYGNIYNFSPYSLSMGLAVWELNKIDSAKFSLSTYKFKRFLAFDFWHYDMFTLDNSLFKIITPQTGNAIYIAKSDDGINFKYFKRPLLSDRYFFHRNYFYKASAVLYKEYIYVFYPLKKSSEVVKIAMRKVHKDVFSSIYK